MAIAEAAAGRTAGNPTARALACAMGRALAKSDPARALRIFAEAGELATSVENNWLIGMAGMEAVATRAATGDPAALACDFFGVMDHRERGGPGLIPMQRDAVGHAVGLLVRLGAHDEAAAVHGGLVSTGWQPWPSMAQPPGDQGVTLKGLEALALARETLRRFCRA